MQQIDITLIAGRRPKLLQRTLESFARNVFDHFQINGVYANVDPIFGETAEEDICVDLIRQYFPTADIVRPASPGFCAAVAGCWQRTSAKTIFHLEDDWLCNEPIGPEDILALAGSTKQLSLLSKEKNWDGSAQYQIHKLQVKLLGVRVYRRMVNKFSTSPSFIDGDFARAASALMDLRLDPEKQFCNRTNMALFRYVTPYKNRLLFGKEQSPLITDIGRQWRDERRIEKSVIDGVSYWRKMANDPV